MNPPAAQPRPQLTHKQQASRNKMAWAVIIVWGLLISLSLAIRAGGIFAPVFLLGTPAVGLFLYLRQPAFYVGYTWWMVFLAPVIRRIIDYQAGYVTFGRWALPALLVTCVSLITLFKYLPTAHRRGGLPFTLSLLGLLYAFAIGIAYDRLDARYILQFLEWIGPLAFGFHLFIHWRAYPEIRQVMQTVFVWGGLVMGSYAIYQFCVVPGWDAFYMDTIQAKSFGSSTPFEIRVFGTQGSPQIFASIMMASLLVLLSAQGIVRFATSGVGYLGLLLTRARSGWFGWCVAMLMLVPSLSLKLQVRLAMTVIVMSILVIPVASIEPFSEVISERLESFVDVQNIEEDDSYSDRVEGYNQQLGIAMRQFVGFGLGTSAGESSLGGADTSILPLLFSFGWFGTIPFMGGIILILVQLFSNDVRSDAFNGACRAVALGVFSQIGFNQILSSEFAILLWGFLGVGMASCKHHRSTAKPRLAPTGNPRFQAPQPFPAARRDTSSGS